jgi:hypothetical protein
MDQSQRPPSTRRLTLRASNSLVNSKGPGHVRAAHCFLGHHLVVAIKYVVFVMRADIGGEGGTMALLSLALPAAGPLQSGLFIVGFAGVTVLWRRHDHSRAIRVERRRRAWHRLRGG